MEATLHRASLHYGAGLVLHTASSGSVGYLDALYLRLVKDGKAGVGEARINIAYLNGLEAAQVLDDARSALAQIDWTLGAQALLDDSANWRKRYSAPVRMMIDSALHDLHARQLGVSVTGLFNADAARTQTWRSNQTLFWSSDETMLERAAGYLARGFHELKLRVGIGAFEDDLRRIDLLRERFGQRVTLSIDANGQWLSADCPARFDALARRAIEYVEQPIAAGDWTTLRELAQTSPLTLMLDESLQSPADIDALIELSGLPVAAHLKLVKLGGVMATIAAARKLTAAGIALMIGQMNEGAAATAAALHVCMATAPRWAELYGADGLLDDPASGLSYEAGSLRVAGRTGLGIAFDASLTQPL
ncbi:mandelate racemase/muconate lactonizing enzyme family protein [Caballeronia sp. SEWSISQ10-4 2]|uniref:mandelate racemase/muconate lactonizing enzyme family protein n=1 Tax=Caballeronia sp. SEWSISQ10-4 2 TaxID=2937438 RepID=UPI00265411D8|nr:mandelate racemase/muconate lactonizing enzyme family protein [Caballeronia sp. SEWSISQ10-4 2]MDN7180654.1 mandelate racemase/muconate lactonizing enzyme family protein [Caballeronia sp. SEWSISQ10-4 2]